MTPSCVHRVHQELASNVYGNSEHIGDTPHIPASGVMFDVCSGIVHNEFDSTDVFLFCNLNMSLGKVMCEHEQPKSIMA